MEWIKCSDRMPDAALGIGHHVLCYTQTGMLAVGWTLYGRWYLGNRYADENGYEVQYWMHLPDPPKA